ncbi:MAG: hypothetical protein FJ343_06320 [Sphingomonadales bacterium]|nr:hypothetical protein [Sphingomonadales bacterium]
MTSSRILFPHWIKIMPLAYVTLLIIQWPNTLAQVIHPQKITLQEALQIAKASWQPLRADSLSILAALREAKAQPFIDPTEINSEWGQVNSAYYDQSMQLSQSLRLPGYYRVQNKIAKTRLDRARIEQRRTLAQLEQDLVNTFYRYQILEKKRKLLQHNDSILAETVTSLKSSYNKGLITIYDLNEVLLIHGESSINLQKITLEFENTLLRFQYLTSSHHIPQTSESILWDEGLIRIGENNISPDLQLLENNDAEAVATSQMSQQMQLPGWSIGLRNMSIQGIGPNGIDYPVTRRFNSLQFGLSLPLWNQPLKEQAKADRLRSASVNAMARHGQENLNSLQRQTLLQIQSLKAQWEQFNQSLLPIADELASQAHSDLASDKINLVQWTLTLQSVLKTKEAQLQLVQDLNEALVRFHYPRLTH